MTSIPWMYPVALKGGDFELSVIRGTMIRVNIAKSLSKHQHTAKDVQRARVVRY